MMPKSEDLGYQVSLLKNQFNEMGDIVLKNVDLAHLQELIKREWIKRLNNYKIPLQNSMETMLLHTLDERFPKCDIRMQGNHENREKKIVEPQSHVGRF
jgi:hypothetical protein